MSAAREVWSVFLDGLVLLRQELGFALGTSLRRLEARALERRLAEEEARGGVGPEGELGAIQAAFLREEAARVRAGMAARDQARRRDKAARQAANH